MNRFLRTAASLVALAICFILMTIYVLEYNEGTFPCPLCYIQQSALIGIIISELLHVRFGTNTKHFALANVSAMLGVAAAFYQLVLNKFQFTSEQGMTVFSLKLYSWSLMIFSVVFLIISISLFLTKEQIIAERPVKLNKFGWIVFSVSLVITCAGGITSFLYP